MELKCELCDVPAARGVVDVTERHPDAPGVARHAVHSEHHFCAAHARPARTYPFAQEPGEGEPTGESAAAAAPASAAAAGLIVGVP